jgi:ATP-dependent Clp protease ATP-binding subunit ClpA
MFEKFTDRARRVIVLAQEEARMLDHNYIGTEHLLLGLIHEGQGVAARALESLGVSLEAVRRNVEEMIGRGQETLTGHIPFTPRAKKVLELSLRESQQLGHDYIGTEHILLGLIREGEGVAAQVLVTLGADLSRVRQQVLQLLGGRGREEAGETEAVGQPEAAGGWAGNEPEVRIAGAPAQMAEILNRLRSIDTRLGAVERHLGLGTWRRGPAAAGPGAAEESGPRSGPAVPPQDEGPDAEAGPPAG